MKILRRLKTFFRPCKAQKNNPVFRVPALPRMERTDMEKIYARVFTSPDGQKVLAHLQDITFMRAFAADASEEHIRYSEGQRALLATILRFVNSGRGDQSVS